ncbi:metal cation transporting ATPase H [Mycolicibacterium insubricum]|uniref:Haloacid dehalogenase n=1 Tax=Mycolicibacterium insubricum TaxID=444597 RepID=A0A1X0D137_9MYCO|nr:cation-translocating P-type ATPase [Mycolicibacterium insubricum]ORA66083.1 haloacid dehalogenase [Mycolicibacterium insubricum]BBZ66140.1 metal cation transporting ATPase H [Mycolicibacterium insubricum]
MGLLSTPLRMAQLATGVALLGGEAALRTGRNVAGAVVDVALAPVPGITALASDAAGMVVEALSGPPVRRTSSRGDRRWVEVRGLNGPDDERIAAEVLIFLKETPGVREAVINEATSRVVVTVAGDGPDARALAGIVAEAEEFAVGTPQRQLPTTLPGDDAALAARLLAAYVSTVGLGIGTAGAALRAMGLTRAVAAPFALAGASPTVRHRIQAHLGPDGTELAMALTSTVTGSLTLSVAGLANEAVTRWMLAAEAVTGRRSWERAEERLATEAFVSPSTVPTAPRDPDATARGIGDRYADRAAAVGLGAALGLGAYTRDSDLAGAAALTAIPRPIRSTREAFAISLGRRLTGRHGALILRPAVLRRLDVIDTLLIDPRVLYTDELSITLIDGVTPARRAKAWEAARAALADGTLTPGWHKLSAIPGAGRGGQALVSALRDPLASALVTEARRVGLRVITLDDDGLRSLGQGFDELTARTGSVDESLADALTALRDAGRRVAVLTASADLAARAAEVTVGLWRTDGPPPWGADLLLPDLAAAWRFIHALPAASLAAQRGVQASASASVLGALMLIPDVPGSGPGSVNLSALAALWTGYRLGAKVFDAPLPHPESGHDWYALPVDEVARLLPRPEHPVHIAADQAGGMAGALTPLHPVADAVGSVWSWAGDMVAAIREDLDDPITPILATGAAATALLGSPLDAAMVAGVLLLNTSISAQQSVHAEHVLGELLAVQEPQARRLLGAIGERDFEMLSAGRLELGDLFLVVSGEVIPADGRIVAAESAEADESTLTGESLPVSKSVDATPGAPLAERSGMVFAGTTLVTGRVTAIVTATGATTQMNRASAMQARKARKVGLQAQLTHITNKALPWSIAGGGAVGLLSLLRGNPIRQAAASGVAIGVAAVPEGLPLVVTLAQLSAARRLTESEVLIRNPRAIEAFARLDVVCFDKTGTLSENRLQVTAIRGVNGVEQADVLAAAADTVLPRTGKRIDHATDEAIRLKAAELGMTITDVDVHLPFQSDRPFAAAIVGNRLSVKGAPEAIIGALGVARDPLTPLIEEMAAAGLRVIAVADRYLTDAQVKAAAADSAKLAELCTAELIPIGVIGIADTPRPSARPLLEELQARGIGVRLITGDHPVTAKVIANDLGLTVSDAELMTGTEWELLTADGRIEAVKRAQVFARMAPEHKVQVVQALEAADLVTAMVGDGANDAAAIRAATVGVGLVASGSDTARTAADVLLLDGQIGALVDAIDEGHQLWRRVQAAVSMLVGHNLGEVSFALITSMLTGHPALSARQILLINMLTDALPAAALAVSPQLGNGLADFDEAALWRSIYLHGVSTTIGATGAWALGRMTGRPERAATVGLAGLVLTQLFSILSESHGPLVVATSAGTFVVMAGVITIPGVSNLFGCTPLGPVGWGQAALAAAGATAFAKVAPGAVEQVGEWLGDKLGSAGDAMMGATGQDRGDDDPEDVERAERRRQAEEEADESPAEQSAEDFVQETVPDIVTDIIEDL